LRPPTATCLPIVQLGKDVECIKVRHGPVPRHVGNSRLVTEPTSKDASCNCEEDRTLRAVLVGMLREGAHS
jgi:hypothetical protein